MTFGRNVLFNIAVSTTTTIPTTAQSTVTSDGVTFTFDRAMPAGTFEDGAPFVISDQAFSITAISPASGDLQSDGFVGNGAMQDPSSNAGQGFDGYLNEGNNIAAAKIPYSGALNVDPAVSGALALSAGVKTSIVKSVRTGTTTASTWNVIDRYVTLTVLDVVPLVGALRPGFAGVAKPITTRSEIAYTPRGYSLPSSWPDVATIMGRIPSHIGIFGHNGELRRRTRLDSTLGATNDNYSGEFTPAYAQYVYLLNSSVITAGQREEIENRIIAFAGDIRSLVDAGWRENATRGNLAGQGGGIWLWLIAAAAITGDQSYLAAANIAVLQPVGNGFWVSEVDVGMPAPGKSGVAAQTFFPEHVGIPWITPDEAGSHHGERYFHIAADIIGWEIVAALSFQDGPVEYEDGLAMILDGGANDTTNQRAASLNFLTRRYTWTTNFASSYSVTEEWRGAWDEMLNANALALWSGQPDQPPGAEIINQKNPYFSAGTGSVTLNTRGVSRGYATEPITQIDMAYSLDNVQWIEVPNIALSRNLYTRTGLVRGAPHWCRWRMQSASGAGVWSPTFPYSTPVDNGDHRERVTPTGIESATTPSYSDGVQPAIQKLISGEWDYKVWEPAPTRLGSNDVQLAVGVGYVSAGYPAPSYSFQWKRNGVNISGATAAKYTRMAADAEAVLTCEVIASNDRGSDAVITAGVTCPAIQNPPVGTLINTDFRGAFSVDYATELASLSGSNYNVSHAPTLSPLGIGENYGCLRFTKTGGSPSGTFTLSRAAAAATTYDISGEFVIDGDNFSNRGDFLFEVKEAGGSILFSRSVSGDDVSAAPGDAWFEQIAGQFTTTSTATLEVRVRWTSATGGGSGGNPHISRLIIAPV